MYQNELAISKIYSNGKKRESLRKIVKFVPCPIAITEGYCIRYLTLKGRRSEVGHEYTITRRAFAKWAHHEAMELEAIV
jgi:hypothetical protein